MASAVSLPPKPPPPPPPAAAAAVYFQLINSFATFTFLFFVRKKIAIKASQEEGLFAEGEWLVCEEW